MTYFYFVIHYVFRQHSRIALCLPLMCARHAVSKNPRATFLAARGNSSNSLRITSLADPHPLTPIESHPYEKHRGGGYLPHQSQIAKSRVCHRSEKSPVSPIIATLPKMPFRKSFACHTCGPLPPPSCGNLLKSEFVSFAFFPLIASFEGGINVVADTMKARV